jgi:hypothetical protein
LTLKYDGHCFLLKLTCTLVSDCLWMWRRLDDGFCMSN